MQGEEIFHCSLWVQFMESLAKVAFARGGNRCMLKGKGFLLLLFPIYVRSLLIFTLGFFAIAG